MNENGTKTHFGDLRELQNEQGDIAHLVAIFDRINCTLLNGLKSIFVVPETENISL